MKDRVWMSADYETYSQDGLVFLVIKDNGKPVETLRMDPSDAEAMARRLWAVVKEVRKNG